MPEVSIDKNPVVPTKDRWFTRAGIWFWAAIALGAALRLYLLIFTQGTEDVAIWERHASNVQQFGLIGYYRFDESPNHPPIISYLESLVLRAAQVSGIPFRVLHRAPFALIDAGTTFLLIAASRTSRWRFARAAGYWLNPLAIIFSAYHGNTDTAIPFFLLLCVWLLSKQQLIGGAVAAGASLWIKLPGLLAIPALVLFVRGWRQRLIFLVVAGVTAASTYLPAVLMDTKALFGTVFAYRGLPIHTTAYIPVWGPKVLLFSIIAAPSKWPEQTHAPILFFLDHSWQFALILAFLLVWLRRSRRSVPDVCATMGMLYVVVYGFSDNWAFQYFAWSLPFWFFLSPWFFGPATALGTAYIYSLYWLLCGSPWLLGKWDFIGHPYWPPLVLGFRDFAFLFFFISACVFLVSAMYKKTAVESHGGFS